MTCGSPSPGSVSVFIAGSDLHLSAPSVRIPGPAFQVDTLPGYDQSRMRAVLVYPDVWWRHDTVGMRAEA
jgi:putative acetyltransferase